MMSTSTTMTRMIKRSFRDGRLALGDELVNICGKRCNPPQTAFFRIWSNISLLFRSVQVKSSLSTASFSRLRGLPKEKAASIIAEAGRSVHIWRQSLPECQSFFLIMIIDDGNNIPIRDHFILPEKIPSSEFPIEGMPTVWWPELPHSQNYQPGWRRN